MSAASTADRIRVLELRSVRGTGGGPEKTIMFGAAMADRSRFDITVCYIRDSRDDVFKLDARASKLPIDYVEVREKHSFDTGIWADLKKIIKDRRIDIVHAHEYKTDLVAYLLGKRTGIIPLATAHAWTGHTTREHWVYYPVDKRVLAKYPHVIAVSSEIKDELIRCGADPRNVTVILNGIDPSAFIRQPAERDRIRAELGYSPADVVIGAVGRLEPQKRFDLLLEAVQPLVATFPNTRVAIVGDGSLRESLSKQIAERQLDRHCRLLGHRDDIASLHNAFDLFVQSSEYEGTPNAVLEAMAMETPVIATDAGGTKELALPDVHATIVPINSLVALRSAIESALHDPARMRTKAVAARRRIETDLSFEARTRRLESVYADLMQKRTARA